MSRFERNYRDPYMDDDEDDEDYMDEYDDDADSFDDDELSPEEIDAAKYNELVIRQLSDEICELTNRGMVEFLSEELDSLGFSESSELILVGLEFSNSQYVLEFYNIREDQTVKSATGAGNFRMLVDGWVLKTITELQVLNLYGELVDELKPSDLTDCYMNLLLDILDWKEAHCSDNQTSTEDDGDREDDPKEHCE